MKENNILQLGMVFFFTFFSPLLMEHVTNIGLMIIKKMCIIYYLYIECTQSFIFDCSINKVNFKLGKKIMHISKKIVSI